MADKPISIHCNLEYVTAILEPSRPTYHKMVHNFWWAAGYNIVAIPLAAGLLFGGGLLLGPTVGSMKMSASRVIVAINARFLKLERNIRRVNRMHARVVEICVIGKQEWRREGARVTRFSHAQHFVLAER